MKARVHVSLKPGVLDPQGKAVQHALVSLGFPRPSAMKAVQAAADSAAGETLAIEEWVRRALATVGKAQARA